MTWRVPPLATTPSMALVRTSLALKEPSLIALLISESDWYTMRPAPMLRWPTSELPIWPSGRPTSSPEAPSVVVAYFSTSESKKGLLASDTAFSGPAGARPQPSMMTRRAGVRTSLITLPP